MRFAPVAVGLRALVVGVALLLGAVADPVGAIEAGAPRSLIMDADSGSILYARAPDEIFAPANFAKLVTAAVIFDAIAKGDLAADQTLPISEHAWRTGGAPAGVTTMFAEVKSEVAVSDLLKGLIVQYGNDAAIALAEGLAGSEAAFAERMNAFAAEIGMVSSRFANPTGFPDPAARTTLDDLATLVNHIRIHHPAYHEYYGLADFRWNGILQLNKTAAIREVSGVEGLMLAFDEAAGFGAAISALREGRRVLVLVGGLKSEDERDRQIRTLVDAAFGDFVEVTLYPPGRAVTTVRVYGGLAPRVPVTGEGAVRVTLPREGRDDFRARVVYEGPVPAPVAKGQAIAALEIHLEDRVVQRVPLVAAEPVPAGDMLARARDGLRELLFGWW